eukprot:921021_1
MSYPFFEQHLRMLLLPLAYSLTNTNHQFLGYHMAEKWTLPNFDLASSQPILPTTITAFNPLFHFDSCDPKTRTIINSSTNGVSELSSLHSTTNSIIFDGSIRHKSVPFKWRRLKVDVSRLVFMLLCFMLYVYALFFYFTTKLHTHLQCK